MKNILILGCGRSGTSIFGEFFKHLKPYSYLSEPPFSSLLNWDYSKPLAVKVPREDAKLKADDGLSFPLDVLLSHFKEPYQIYWQVRHPLDTICSLKVGISKNWGHHPRPLDWESWLKEPLIKQCAHHWNYLNTIGFSRVKSLVKIKYFEDMLSDSLAFANLIAEEVGADVMQNKSAILKWANRVQDKNNKDFIEAETSRPYSTNDHKVKVGRWQENLTQEELDMALPIIQNTARTFGYKLP